MVAVNRQLFVKVHLINYYAMTESFSISSLKCFLYSKGSRISICGNHDLISGSMS